jgi:hypothetical protein
MVLELIADGLYGHLNALEALRRFDKGFVPFCFSVEFKWCSLLSDFRLIRSKEDWERLSGGMKKIPPEEYSVFRSGFRFTVLASPSGDARLPGLTHLDNRKRFVRDLDFSESITGTAYLSSPP